MTSQLPGRSSSILREKVKHQQGTWSTSNHGVEHNASDDRRIFCLYATLHLDDGR